MKINSVFFLALLTASSLGAAPLTKSTAVHAKPDASSPTIAVLNAGTEAPLATAPAAPLPSGWSAVELAGPHEVYVMNKDLLKSNDVRAGSAFHLSPKVNSPVFATMEKGDSAEVTGLLPGKWTQIRLQKKIIGYINDGTPAAVASSAAPTPAAKAPSAPAATAPAPFSPAPVAPGAYASGGAGRPAQMVNLGDGGSSALPRLFEGKIVSTRHLLTPRRPYDYQLNDVSGQRYAYLDLSRLLQTEQLDKYIDHTVAVYGTAKPVPDTKDIVIEVESLQLR